MAANSSLWMPSKKPQTDEELMQSLGMMGPQNSSQMPPPSPGFTMPQPSFPQAAVPENLGAAAQGVPQTSAKPVPVQRKPKPIVSPALAAQPEAQAADPQNMGLHEKMAHPIGSGLRSDDKVAEDHKSQTIDREGKLLPTPAIQDAFSTLRNTPEFKDLFDSEAKMPGILQSMNNRPNQLDLSPIMALANFETHGQFKPEYTPPETIQARNASLLSNIQKNQDDKRDIVKSLIAGLAAQKSPGYTQLLTTADLKKSAEEGSFAAKLPTSRGGAGKPYDPTKDVKDLQHALEPYSGLQEKFNTLKGSVEQDIGGPLSAWDGKKDISGLGRTKMLPQALLSDAGARNRESYADLKNGILKALNGSRITNGEAQRLNRALGDTTWGGDRDVILGMNNFQREMKSIMAQKEAMKAGLPHAKEIFDAYHKVGPGGEGGGTTSESIPSGDIWTPKSLRPKSAAPLKSKEELMKMSEADYNAYEASLKGGK